MEDLRQVVSSRVRELREAAGLTQSELANAAGNMSLSYVGALEQSTKSASLETLQRLSRALGVEVADLVKPGGKRRNRRGPRSPEEHLAHVVAALARGAEKKKIER